jgi:hypothetical protein
MIQSKMAFITLQSVFRGSLTCKILGVHHQPLDVEPGTGTSFPVAFSRLHCVVVVAGSAIIASTILDTITTKTPTTLPYDSPLRLRHTSGEATTSLAKTRTQHELRRARHHLAPSASHQYMVALLLPPRYPYF